MKKGYFPHLYSTEEILSHPLLERLPHLLDASFYDPNNMSCKKRDEFLLWYEKNKHFPFDYHRELLMYCQSNVDILLKACWKFRELFMHSTGPDNPVDPFDYTTIASICMGMFRAKCLPKEWEVLLKTNASPKCTHHSWTCKCIWTHARKIHGDAPLEILSLLGNWMVLLQETMAMSQFV